MRRKTLAALASGLAVSLVMGAGLAAAASAQSVKSGGTLYTAMPWGTIPDNFNPFLPAGSNAGGTMSIIYETLFYDNVVNGQITPILGTSYTWSEHNLKLVITTRSHVRWSDGTPFSARDVAFTFNYIHKNPALDIYGIWTSGLKAVVATGPDTVTFTFSKPDTPIFYFITEQVIVPEHIWATVKDPSTFTNTHPVGSGPFTLTSYSPYEVAYLKNPHYWMTGRPYLHSVVIEAVKSNNTPLLDLIKGTIGFTYTYVPDIPRTYAARDPAVNKYWWPVTNVNILYMNTQESPFTELVFRRAVARALNTSLIAQRAYYGAIGPANEAAVFPGQVKPWFNPALKALQWHYNPAGARKILAQAGYKWNSSGQIESPHGNSLPTFRILVGAGWTDFITMAQIIASELKTLGISTVIDQEPYSTYESSILTGRYDMAISWGAAAGPAPYYLYDQGLGSWYSAKRIGQTAVSDWARFTSPAIDRALLTYQSTSSPAVQRQAMSTIERIVLTQVPFVPLTNRPNFFDYQVRQFTGFPDAANPYNAGDPPDSSGADLMYVNVHLK